jgi:hypothetical protein
MTIEQAVVEWLEDWPAVTAIAGSRVYREVAPENEFRPHVRVQLIDEPRQAHLRGPESLLVSLVQVDAFAQQTDVTPEASGVVSDLAAAIEDALGPRAPFTVGSIQVVMALRNDRRPFEPDEHDNFRMMQDFRIWHRPA